MLIIFDMDGVLLDARDIHYESLNEAFKEVGLEKYQISREDHLTKYDGLPTRDKLSVMVKEGLFSEEVAKKINTIKQMITLSKFSWLEEDQELRTMMRELKAMGCKLACASNSRTKTVQLVMDRLGLSFFLDLILGNDDIEYAKPNPAIYYKVMSILGEKADETLIVEDSPHGRQAALATKAHTLFVENRGDLNLDKVLNAIGNMSETPTTKYKNKKLNVLIPMAGGGTRFAQAGYTFPKPLIEVKGRPMIQVVVDSLNIDANYIYIVQKEHFEKYHLGYMLNIITPGCQIVQVDGITEGAAVTTLLARYYINNDSPLLIANSDQYINWNPTLFMHAMTSDKLDGGMLTFEANHPKWSFAKLDEQGFVSEVAEKKPISTHATVGVYYWAKGSDYVKYAEQMIEANRRVNNEFYVCPVFNEAIADGKRFKTFPVNSMQGLGTPEDLERFLSQ